MCQLLRIAVGGPLYGHAVGTAPNYSPEKSMQRAVPGERIVWASRPEVFPSRLSWCMLIGGVKGGS